MKKILSLLVLSLLLVGLIAPVMAGAQDEKIKECCTIHQAINLGTDVGTCAANAVAAPTWEAAKLCNAAITKGEDEATASLMCPVGKLGNWGMFCLVNVIYIVTNWIFYLMMIGVVIVFVIAGAMYMMSSGDPEKTKSAKGLMIFGVVGLVIALVAKLVPSVVKLIVAM